MHLLIVHRYYWPDTPAYAKMLHIMAANYVANGHRVTVFSTQPCYNGNYLERPAPSRDVVDGIEIIRTPLFRESKKTRFSRGINVLLFCFSLILHCFFRPRKYDLISVASFPPVVMGFTARLIGFFTGIRYLYHCQDLYPETLVVSGMLKRTWLAKILTAIDRRNCQKAVAVVVLSGDMRETVLQRDDSLTNIYVVNNFIIDEFDAAIELEDELRSDAGKFRVIFAGNLGKFQNLDALIESAHLLSDEPNIHFWFVGAGAMKSELMKAAGSLLDQTIFFRPFLPLKKAMAVIAESDMSVISLNRGVVQCAFPSKTMSYLESGSRLLLSVETDSELADFVRKNDLGSVCSEASAEGMAAAIRTEFGLWKTQPKCDKRIRAVGRKHFGQSVVLRKWNQLLESIDESK